MESVAAADELVREYLLFRGYVKTLGAFNAEQAADKTRFPEVRIHHFFLSLFFVLTP